MGIKATRKLALKGYTKEDISEAKRYLSYYVNSYSSGESSASYGFTKSPISSDKIMKVIVKYFNYLGVAFTYTYRKETWYKLTINFK